MEKPIIFFSHSSKDKDFLVVLKNKILDKTSNTIEVFQSSDGESIPFGNNWVHKIEDNLKNTTLMFVFVSPNSLRSNWIYFESGFSYSKGVKVIPIGINGIDIGNLAPPINLLQGYNMTSHEGLNNLIAIINKEFESSFPEDFVLDDYMELINHSNNVISSSKYFDNVDYIETSFPRNLANNTFDPMSFRYIKEYLDNENIKYSQLGPGPINISGMNISPTASGITFGLDPLKLSKNIEIVDKLLPLAYAQSLLDYFMFIYFNDDIEVLTTNFKLSSRLSNRGIEMTENIPDIYTYKSISFGLFKQSSLRQYPTLRIIYKVNNFQEKEVIELIDLLFEQGALKFKN